MQIEDMLGVNRAAARQQADYKPLTVDEVKKSDGGYGVRVEEGDTRNSFSIDRSVYNKNDIAGDTAADRLDKSDGFGADARAQKNMMVLASETMSPEDYRAMEESGFSPMDMAPDEIITVSDQIKLQLAKAGADIEAMGGLSDSELTAMTGSVSYANSIERALSEADLPADDALVAEGAAAMQKLSELPEDGALSDESVKYMLKNELPPTIDNVYKAVFSQTASLTLPDAEPAITDEDWETLLPQARDIVAESGRADTDEALADARWLLSEGLPLTPENLTYKETLSELSLDIDDNEALRRITDAVSEGARPGEAYLADGYSLHDIAEAAAETVTNATEADADAVIAAGRSLTIESLREAVSGNIAAAETADGQQAGDGAAMAETGDSPDRADIAVREQDDFIRAHRQLEEARLMMTQDANLALLKRGISIDTTELAALVEELAAIERAQTAPYPGVFDETPAERTEAVSSVNKWELYVATNETVEELRTLPAAMLGKIPDVDSATLPGMQTEGRAMARRLSEASERYDVMQTEVRRDLGDSIQKAFRNVDDILSDLDIEITEENQRAVRILAYNELSITAESVATMREADIKVSGMLRGLTPGVVKELIDRGDNPLDLRVEQLVQKIDDIRSELDSTSDGEGFASFLWKAEHAGEITDEQRESYIGIYRLLHQVEKTDGAAIGQLLHQGADITLRNLMGAVRTARHEGREYTVDDSFGELAGQTSVGLSITEQAEVAFQTRRAGDARALMTPARMSVFGSESEYLDTTPDGFATALEQTAADPAEEAAYTAEKQSRLREAVMSEERVYEMLRAYDMPATGANLEAMSLYMKDSNAALRRVFGNNDEERRTFGSIEAEGREATLSDILDDIIEDFGEAVRAPEELAEAQRKLADIAENVMKTSLPISDGSIDVRSMRQAVNQLHTLADMGKKSETYAIPIVVGDELGNLSLRIVRGKDDERGLVDIVFNTETTGAVSASFRYEDGGVTGELTSARNSTREMLSDHAGLLAKRISDETGMPATLSFGLSDHAGDLTLPSRTDTDEAAADRSEISTRRLYGVARAFITALTDVVG